MIFATNNEGKLKQIKDLAPDIEIKGLKECGINIDIDEDGVTLEDNAIKKAKTIYDLTKKAVVADDSGLFIDYFDGWPGVYTHRCFPNFTARERNEAILEKMKNVDDNLRKATVRCVLAVCDNKGEVHIFKGEVDCKITKAQRGDNFFGFDSITEIEGGKTVAELTDSEKEKVNARSIAFRLLYQSYLNGEMEID